MCVCVCVRAREYQEVLVDDCLGTETIKNFIDGSLEKLDDIRYSKCVCGPLGDDSRVAYIARVSFALLAFSLCMCVCVCVCTRQTDRHTHTHEREKERERESRIAYSLSLCVVCFPSILFLFVASSCT